MREDIQTVTELTLRVELFKPDGFKVNFDGKPLIYGDLCPGCGPNRLDVSGKPSPHASLMAMAVLGNAGFADRLCTIPRNQGVSIAWKTVDGRSPADGTVPLLWHLDKNPCIKPLQGYSYTVTNNQVIKGGGNAGTFGCVDGIEQESLKKAQEEARVYRASHKPVVNTNTGTGSVTSGVGSGGIKCGDGDLEGCSGGKRYICDYTAAGKGE